jgi:hypothetical protein
MPQQSIMVERKGESLVTTFELPDGSETQATFEGNQEQLHTTLASTGWKRVGMPLNGDPICGVYVRNEYEARRQEVYANAD